MVTLLVAFFNTPATPNNALAASCIHYWWLHGHGQTDVAFEHIGQVTVKSRRDSTFQYVFTEVVDCLEDLDLIGVLSLPL